MMFFLGVDEADFTYLKEQTSATSGNLSVQIDKLAEAGYIEVEKGFRGEMPRTVCRPPRAPTPSAPTSKRYANTSRQGSEPLNPWGRLVGWPHGLSMADMERHAVWANS